MHVQNREEAVLAARLWTGSKDGGKGSVELGELVLPAGVAARRRCLRSLRYQGGFSLVELMVALAVGLFITLAASSFLVTNQYVSFSVQKTANAQDQFTSVASAISSELRRAGYRGRPTEVGAYLQDTATPMSTANEGRFPAVDISTPGCVLLAYAERYECASGDNTLFSACANEDGSPVTTDIALHQRVGFRLNQGVVEGVSVVHPDAYDSGTPAGETSDCAASGSSSAWQAITSVDQLYFDRFIIALDDEIYFDADNGCQLGSTGCDSDTSNCGDSISCRVDRLYKVELCAYGEPIDNLCVPSAGGTQPDGQLFSELFITPRNNVLLARSYTP